VIKLIILQWVIKINRKGEKKKMRNIKILLLILGSIIITLLQCSICWEFYSTQFEVKVCISVILIEICKPFLLSYTFTKGFRASKVLTFVFGVLAVLLTIVALSSSIVNSSSNNEKGQYEIVKNAKYTEIFNKIEDSKKEIERINVVMKELTASKDNDMKTLSKEVNQKQRVDKYNLDLDAQNKLLESEKAKKNNLELELSKLTPELKQLKVDAKSKDNKELFNILAGGNKSKANLLSILIYIIISISVEFLSFTITHTLLGEMTNRVAKLAKSHDVKTAKKPIIKMDKIEIGQKNMDNKNMDKKTGQNENMDKKKCPKIKHGQKKLSNNENMDKSNKSKIKENVIDFYNAKKVEIEFNTGKCPKGAELQRLTATEFGISTKTVIRYLDTKNMDKTEKGQNEIVHKSKKDKIKVSINEKGQNKSVHVSELDKNNVSINENEKVISIKKERKPKKIKNEAVK
jgi:hypothetical protein